MHWFRVCAFIECLVGDVIRIKDTKKKVQLFLVESVQTINLLLVRPHVPICKSG